MGPFGPIAFLFLSAEAQPLPPREPPSSGAEPSPSERIPNPITVHLSPTPPPVPDWSAGQFSRWGPEDRHRPPRRAIAALGAATIRHPPSWLAIAEARTPNHSHIAGQAIAARSLSSRLLRS